MPLNVLIVGAGVAGPALAIFLQGSNPSYNITVLERAPSLRTAGQQIDFKNQAVDVMKKMGILEAVKSLCVHEIGSEIVDSNGKGVASFGITPAGQQGRGLTSEYEIMRGDLVNLLYETSLKQNEKVKQLGKEGGLVYEFGKSLEDLAQDDNGVDVTFSDGQKRRYDIVVAADGYGSRTRRLAFGQEANDEAFKSTGVHAAYYSIPRIEGEGGVAKIYNAHGRRLIVLRPSDRPVTQVLLFTMAEEEKLKKCYKESVEKQKEAFAEIFKDAGWQSDRLLKGLKTCTDLYVNELAQIKMKQLHTGRVVLLGDAGYCPTPFTGMGTLGCFVGAYVLAGELARHGNNVSKAFSAYNETIKTPVEELQKLPSLLGVFLPSSRVGVWILRNLMWAASKFEPLIPRSQGEDPKRWKLPEYPELNLK
ncbi:FAD/NAD(P)-binding domain-containing protein [Hypoxylon trugodes]|uniref:FAD/NAD(P)-binding domain-containing protein n=1 Tax=Hypoxylon trugodes TaxID=326681 RepID=UPI00218D74FB|nr:FAD/NAD(P)-binding domain-containing protein [Hypoxylon trugodes]KAI1384844.1 FAD/NAD(P)-binding domain-containing protein [Hypoxylon trugodes]